MPPYPTETHSVGSRGSKTTSSRYRTKASRSNIDESLFGHQRNSVNNLTTKKQYNHANSKLDVTPAVVALTENDLERIQGYITQSPIWTLKRVDSTNHEESRTTKDIALARKERMLELDRQMKRKESEDRQLLMDAKMGDLRRRALEQCDQEEDIVKLLNTCRQRAAAFAIRDQQLRDKEEKKKKEQEYEKMTDLAMEADRLRELAEREREENVKVQKRIADRRVIEQQIEERRNTRLLQEEAREQENQLMLQTIRRYQTEAQENAMKKKHDARKAQLDVLKWNDEILLQRKLKQDLEMQEDEMIQVYQAEREEQMRRREEEEKEAARRKQEIQKQLLESQTKVLDKHADLDELRSRRAFEDTERKHRQRELQEIRKRQHDVLVMTEACRQQQEEKRDAQERERRLKAKEYEDADRIAAETNQKEKEDAEKTKRKNDELRKLLQEQIHENERKRRLEREQKFEEGISIKDKTAFEMAKIEAIRDAMVQDMKAKGVNEKYFGEMKSLDVGKYMTR